MPKKKLKAKKGRAKKDAQAKITRKDVMSTGDEKMLGKLKDAPTATGSFVNFQVVGDRVAGEILAIETVKGRWGEQQKVTVAVKGGAATFFCSTLLKRELDRIGANIGDLIAVEFRGTVPSGKGAPAKTFAVVHEPAKKRGKK